MRHEIGYITDLEDFPTWPDDSQFLVSFDHEPSYSGGPDSIHIYRIECLDDLEINGVSVISRLTKAQIKTIEAYCLDYVNEYDQGEGECIDDISDDYDDALDDVMDY
jgi:hypothetical protein